MKNALLQCPLGPICARLFSDQKQSRLAAMRSSVSSMRAISKPVRLIEYPDGRRDWSRRPIQIAPLHPSDEAGLCLPGYCFLSRTTHKRYGRQWRRPKIAVEIERYDHRCRFQRSIVRSPDRQSSRRGDSRPRSCRRRDRQRWSHSAPTIARGCTADPGQSRPESACTIRTRRQAVRHSHDRPSSRQPLSGYFSNGQNPHRRNPSYQNPSCQNPNYRNSSSWNSRNRNSIRRSSRHTRARNAGSDDGHSADNDDEFAPLRSLRMQKAIHSRQRLYAYCLPSYC